MVTSILHYLGCLNSTSMDKRLVSINPCMLHQTYETISLPSVRTQEAEALSQPQVSVMDNKLYLLGEHVQHGVDLHEFSMWCGRLRRVMAIRSETAFWFFFCQALKTWPSITLHSDSAPRPHRSCLTWCFISFQIPNHIWQYTSLVFLVLMPTYYRYFCYQHTFIGITKKLLRREERNPSKSSRCFSFLQRRSLRWLCWSWDFGILGSG